MRKILFIIPFLSGGGAERVVSILSTEMALLGADINLLVYYRTKNEYSIGKGVQLFALAGSESEYNSFAKYEKILRLRKKIKEINPDVVIPFIAHVGIMASLATIGFDFKIVETIRIDPRYSPSGKLMRCLRNLSVMSSHRCIVQNEQQKHYFPKFIREKMMVLPNPISNEFLTQQKKWSKKEVKNIIAVGRLEKQKNYPLLINAFSCVARVNEHVKLKIYGEGSLYDELSAEIKELGLSDRVFLCGRTDNILQALLTSDLFVLSSDAEGMPNSLMEAMAVGLPCISTDCPTGPSDLIQNAMNGYLIPVGDENALVESINRIVSNPDIAVALGKEARKTIIGNYNPEFIAKKLLSFIETI